MSNDKKECKIKVIKDGPYIVSGNVPLYEKIIVKKGKGYELKDGREIQQSSEYALCRCGKSKNPPFCDGSHVKEDFVGTETAEKSKFEDRAEILEGTTIDLLDDKRCAFARFCHSENGSAWELTKSSDTDEKRNEAIKAASECPAGRLVAVDKDGNMIEPEYEPSIEILQDPEKQASAGIFVKGGIPIESADGDIYERRNRVTLCRCGKSKNKPFCDGTHDSVKFLDRE
ncbi:zinc finger CDGSH-type domain-containing protein [Gottschalkia acidurici 9a]|uniref:Zinc finger CDGSH-type domain-containing protein n=1 Tax=Gottschalkia acidurici (strain ATCC 7906 / DSM 604 / BCRC 14475 / CIP 104303 / KCTC 5404 / NCIMB 10678 / 9a) TaxID=1128398 RepID=K0AYG7_GOTA9|nr:CDGSH iron-sulfur domain-containing protein [Gottschalkia acidurici]AFS77817.1 zinc finger CDGSH-type domain-containing protein [Gottschalkia acidurici 9a]